MKSAAARSGILPVRESSRERNPVPVFCLNEVLASLMANKIPGCDMELGGFLPVLLLIRKSAAEEKALGNNPMLSRSARVGGSWAIPLSTDAKVVEFKDTEKVDRFAFGDVTVCTSTMEVRRGDEIVEMTCKEFKMLSYLASSPWRVHSRDELLKEVWGYNCYPTTRTVDNHIMRLRQKLEQDPGNPKHFVTMHGSGYKFIP
jgi:DNA-binding response OmpR family regulator